MCHYNLENNRRNGINDFQVKHDYELKIDVDLHTQVIIYG